MKRSRTIGLEIMGISLIAFVIITYATNSANIQTSHAQQNQTTLINQTKWTNYFENSKVQRML